ncbi:uncharacterized protein GGS22DRAFT_145395 [Annulohypoxylon maeteangense]|uniref:uncharacterized protein n=1 Tax=Annulohypoxylon maeteangense TaxID=1927788 RepID=UPI002007B870|nr:uncharacterized protein GGS22DRAFT_145395 [Annulohypoxylon maeteangense]KAI0884655.1 hypothetical protein GGS22DRAFT_145395 [Annulohypoxylon maeteangense]
MMKPRLSLLLLWSLWSTTGLGLSEFVSDGDRILDNRKRGDGERNDPVAVRWDLTGRNDEAQLPSITAAPIIPTESLLSGPRLQIRQTTATTTDSDDADDDDDDDGPPPPPGAPPPVQASFSISNSVSASVSSSVAGSVAASVAASVTGVFTSSLLALSAASSSAVISARAAGIAEGISSATAGATTAAPPPTTGATSSTSAASATNTNAASAIANIQTSASKAVEEAQASASISAQSAVEAAKASASAIMANASPQSQGSSLTPGQIGGIVISIAFISSLLSALATFLLMRRKARQQDDSNKYEPDLYAPRTLEPILPPVPEPRPHSLSQSIRNRLSSFHAMFGAPIMPPYRRSQSPSNSNVDAFSADIKRRPPTSEHPAMAMAMSHNARPLSDPVFPVSPVSSVGDQSLILQSTEPQARLQPSPPVPVIVEAAASPVPATAVSASARASAALARVSLAREQVISGGQRPYLVRVGSGREQSGDPLSMNPVSAELKYDVAPPVSATGQCHMTFPTHLSMEDDGHGGWRTSGGTEMSSTPSFQVQAPIPRRLVDPVSLEQGPNYLPHAY